MTRTVLLHHDLGEESHYDWMIERGEGTGLITFRVDVRFDDGLQSWLGERIGDHREAYLDYEGEVSGGRGQVTRVAAGTCRVVEEADSRLLLDMDMGEVTGLVSGRVMDGDLWRFEWVE